MSATISVNLGVFTDVALRLGALLNCGKNLTAICIATVFIEKCGPHTLNGGLGRLVASYCSEVLMEVNLVLSLMPSPFTTAMMASEIPSGKL